MKLKTSKVCGVVLKALKAKLTNRRTIVYCNINSFNIESLKIQNQNIEITNIKIQNIESALKTSNQFKTD